jgi:hypothetical protein
MEKLKAYLKDSSRLTSHIPSESDWNIISSKLIKQVIPKKQVLIKKGQIENYLAFIESGVARFISQKKKTI